MNDTIDTAGIAEILGCSRKHVTDRVTKRPDFPVPYIEVSRKNKRWLLAEVMAWASPAARRSQLA